MQIAHIPVTGDITFHEVEKVELDRLYSLTGATTVEAVGLSRDGEEATCFLDEEGKLAGREVNPRADWLLHMTSGVAPYDTIVGDAVIVGGTDDEGESMGLTEAWQRYIREEVAAAVGLTEPA